jgi:hypothetical protein
MQFEYRHYIDIDVGIVKYSMNKKLFGDNVTYLENIDDVYLVNDTLYYNYYNSSFCCDVKNFVGDDTPIERCLHHI